MFLCIVLNGLRWYIGNVELFFYFIVKIYKLYIIKISFLLCCCLGMGFGFFFFLKENNFKCV